MFVVLLLLRKLVLVIVRGPMESARIQKRTIGVVVIKHLHALCVLMDMAPVGVMGSVVGTMEAV